MLDDPKYRELVEEILRLSTEFGILTEYTAFLAREGSDLTRHQEVALEAWRNLNALSPGYRRKYVLWLTTAKRADTLVRRPQARRKLGPPARFVGKTLA